MNVIRCVSLSTALFFSAHIQADESSQTYQQEKTVVTASRYAQAEDDIIPSVSIINRQDILNLQANNILDILSLQQGIDVARSGGNGAQTSVFMRGTNSNHTLVLIDGMRVGSSFTGSFSWEHLPVSQIERIEIVRGTRVSYYGADAIGGVINIITRKQQNLYLRYTSGSFDTHNFDLGYGNKTDKGYYSLVLGSQKTDGFSATNENNFFGFNPDKDGYENLSVNFNYAQEINTGSIKFSYLDSLGDADFDQGNSDSRERAVRLSLSQEIFNNWSSDLFISNNYNKLDTKAFSSKFDSIRYSIDWLLNKQIDKNHVAFGLSYRKEKADFLNPNATEVSFSDSRNNVSAFAHWRGVFNKQIVSTSIRFDDNSVYGSDASADIDWAYKITENKRLNISVGSAFKAPSINELFSPNFQGLTISPITGEPVFAFSFEGNPDLKPEESINYEMGLKSKIAENQDISFNLFYYNIDNLVDFQGATFKPVNVNQATIKGIEISYTYQKDGLNIKANTTYQDANNDETDTPLLRRPKGKVNLTIDKFFNKFSIGSSIRYATKNPDFGVELEGYTLIDVRAAYQINSHWRIAAKIENATDKNHQIINGYNTSPAAGYLTVEWQQ